MIRKQKVLSLTAKMALYDRLYDIADRMFKRYNPCQHDLKILKKGSNGKNYLKCAYYKKTHSDFRYNCCEYCKHMGNKGCRVKSLGCKLWTCGEIWKNYPHLTMRMNYLRSMAVKYGIPLCIRGTKKESINYLRR